MPRNTLEIIIIKYGQPDYERECVEQVAETVSIPHHLTVYDNYPLDENLSTVWNRLIKRSNADYICLLNNDTIPREGWIETLMSTFETPKIGACGPISNSAGGMQGGHTKPLEKGEIVEANVLSGFCLVFPKNVWKEVGGFDEDFHLYGEDSLFTHQIKKLGYRIIIRFDAFVYHYGKKGTEIAEKRGKDIQKIQREAHELFNKKK